VGVGSGVGVGVGSGVGVGVGSGVGVGVGSGVGVGVGDGPWQSITVPTTAIVDSRGDAPAPVAVYSIVPAKAPSTVGVKVTVDVTGSLSVWFVRLVQLDGNVIVEAGSVADRPRPTVSVSVIVTTALLSYTLLPTPG
jgi:hypothetical protein